nr:Chain Q, ROR2(518-525) peptide [synthetic construct]
REEFRHEA